MVICSSSAAAQYDDGNEVTITDSNDEGNASVNNESTVTFEDQTSDGNSVVVATAFLPEGGYVVIHEVSDGAAGPVVGNSEYLEPGEHSLIDVELDEPLDSDQELIAMNHIDDGNEVYEFPGPDGPYTINGDAVTDSAMMTLETGTTVEDNESTVMDNESTVIFDDQSTEGSMVLVASVSLPDGGYVVIHESGNGSAGTVIGNSEYLEAGNYSDVEIELDTPIDTDQELIAMTHIDDGDQIYQFPGPDVPYTSNGVPVTDPAMVTVESEPSAQTPGFEVLIALSLLFIAGYYYRRKQNN
ncbi:MAG: hypothetical protein SCH66_09725 [Methanolobus sp.]|nr:hypothetical protein [Methanolobus sp.]